MFNIPNIDFEKLRKESYANNKENKNNLSYWFPKIEHSGFLVPDTQVIPLSFEWYKWITSDNYQEEKIKEFGEFLIKHLKENDFNINRPLFLKTGLFSDKFDFSHCKVTNLSKIGEQALDIFYASMCLNADKTSEIVVRELIENTEGRKTIYNGMPLHTEFRVFYDFNTGKILGTFNYWDRQTLVTKLKDDVKYTGKEDDLNNFLSEIDKIETEVEELKEYLENEVKEKMKGIELEGEWSIDFMKSGDNFYLIDMALAQQSYYYELCEK